jgi:hypothetical protein
MRTAEIATVALQLGIGRRQVYRWLEQGLGVYVADALACQLGKHPVEIWPNWTEEGNQGRLRL